MNPYPAKVVMQRMAQLLVLGVEEAPPLPLFVQKGGRVWVQEKYAMSQAAIWPACHLAAGAQTHARITGGSGYAGTFTVELSLYDRWDTQPQTIDAIRDNLDSDIELLMATLQANENLSYGGNAMATSIPRFSLSPYSGEIDESVAGLHLVVRRLTSVINILPYD